MTTYEFIMKSRNSHLQKNMEKEQDLEEQK